MLWKYNYIELNGEKRVCGYCSFDEMNAYGIAVPGPEYIDTPPPNQLMDEYDQPLYILDENHKPILKPIETRQKKKTEIEKKKTLAKIKEQLPEILLELSNGGTFEDLKTRIKNIESEIKAVKL